MFVSNDAEGVIEAPVQISRMGKMFTKGVWAREWFGLGFWNGGNKLINTNYL